MKIVRLLSLIFISGSLISGCAAMVEYDGEEYPATESVDVIKRGEDIPREYEVIGILTVWKKNNLRGQFVNLSRKLVKEAKKRGADAVVMDDVIKSRGERYVKDWEEPAHPGSGTVAVPHRTSGLPDKQERLTGYLLKYK